MCRYVPQLVERVVKDVLDRLGRPALHVADYPVDVQQRVADVKQLLAEHSATGSAVLGLYGMGGIGKTTLAKAVYNELRSEFGDRCCFVEVGKDAVGPQLQRKQHQILVEVCGIRSEVHSVDQGKAELINHMGERRVLLVIDDIWTSSQLDALLVRVGQGSRVLVTTRQEDLLDRHKLLRQPVNLLCGDAAHELFCWHAFLQREAVAAYRGLAAEAVRACAGLPLALTVIGAYLRSRKHKQDWEEALLSLQSAKPFGGGRTADDALWGKLLLSYSSLDGPEQQMFLDIACILLGRNAQCCLPIWQPLAKSKLESLENRSLVRVDALGKLAVHDQLRDMARAIVIKKYEDEWQCWRVQEGGAQQVPQRKQVCTRSLVVHGTCTPFMIFGGRAKLVSPCK